MSDVAHPADVPQSPAPPAAAPPCYPDPIPGVIPFGSICTFAGPAGLGKTAMYAQWTARWRDGKTICGHATNRPTEIGLLVGDRRWQSHRQWFDAVGYSEIRHHSLRDADGFNWINLLGKIGDLPDHFARELDKLELPPGGLVVVDPLPLWLPGTMDYKRIAVGIGLLDTIIRPRDLTMLGVFHTHKISADAKDRVLRPQDRILGSAAQLGYSDTSIYMMGPEELGKPYFGLGWIPHNAPSETFKFIRKGNGLFAKYTGLEDVGTNAEDERQQAIYANIPDDGIRVRDLIDWAMSTFDKSERTVYNDLKALTENMRVTRDEQGYIFRRKPT
jgi:hypothetical protein